MATDTWKDIKGYEGYYQINNKGIVRSLDRKDSKGRNIKGKILKQTKNKNGYFMVDLNKGFRKVFSVHSLVAQAFLNHKPCGMKIVVDHINNIKTDNRAENLQLLTQRENCSKDKKNLGTTKRGNKWESSIKIEGKSIYLGLYESKDLAKEAYLLKLKSLDNA